MGSWKQVNGRIITVRLNTWHAKSTIVQMYAPTKGARDKDKDDFYDQLQDVVSAIPRYDLVVVMGDFNAVIGHDNMGFEDVMGIEANERTTARDF